VITHARAAVPWGTVALGCALVPALMAILALEPGILWPLQGLAVGVVAAVGAWCMDERAAAAVDTLPRALWWRTLARAPALAPPLIVWAACLWFWRDDLPPHLALFALQGVAAGLAGAALATWRRGAGVASPGLTLAPALVAAAAVAALVRPFPGVLPVYPLESADPWGLSVGLWVAATCAACALVALTLAVDAGALRPRR
jgi:hypothetical protein